MLASATVLSSLLVSTSAVAITSLTYRDEFWNESYSGSDGNTSWLSSWVESGESDGPGSGAMRINQNSRCHTDDCLIIGREGGSYASLYRSYGSAGAASVSLTFDYERHKHGSGNGSVELAASQNGTTWTVIATFSLQVEDGNQQLGSYDLSPFAGPNSRIRFSLIGGSDNSHLNVDNVEIVVLPGGQPTFDQNLADRTDSEGSVITIDAGATDPNGDPLTYSANGLPPGIQIDPSTGLITGVVAVGAGAGSPYAASVTVSDGANWANDAFAWTISASNQPPAASDRSVSLPEDDAVGITLDLLDPAFVNDPDGDQLSLVDVDTSTVTGWVITNNGDGTISVTPYPNFDGNDSATYTVADGHGGTATAALQLIVQPSPDSPTIDSPPQLSGAAGTTVSFTAESGDPDTGDTANYSLVDGFQPVPAGAQIDPVTGEFSWPIPANQPSGWYRFDLWVTDSTGQSASVEIAIDVTAAAAPETTTTTGGILAVTTTTEAPTTTTEPPTTTTSSATTTTGDVATTSTTISEAPIPSTTTTVAVNTPVAWPTWQPAPAAPVTTTTVRSMSPEAARTAKETLVAAMVFELEDGEPNSDQSFELTPREGLTVSFSSAVETLRNNLLLSLTLGLVLAGFLLVGVEKQPPVRARTV